MASTRSIYLAVFSATLVGLYSSRRWLVTRNGLLVGTALIGVPVMTWIASEIWRPVFVPRAMLPSMALIALIWAYAFNHLSMPNRFVFRAVTSSALLITFVGQFHPAYANYDLRAWVAPVNAGWKQGDVAFFTSIHSAIMNRHYLHNDDIYLWQSANDLTQTLTEEAKLLLGLRPADFDDIARGAFEQGRCVWYFTMVTYTSKDEELAEIRRIHNSYDAAKIADETFVQNFAGNRIDKICR